MFDRYLASWTLVPDGAPITTHAACLLPVRRNGEPAMLKIALEREEKFGAVLMSWWDGDGAARVLAADADAILLERAMGERSLAAWARSGRYLASLQPGTPRIVAPDSGHYIQLDDPGLVIRSARRVIRAVRAGRSSLLPRRGQ